MTRLWNSVRPNVYLIVSGLALTFLVCLAFYKMGWI